MLEMFHLNKSMNCLFDAWDIFLILICLRTFCGIYVLPKICLAKYWTPYPIVVFAAALSFSKGNAGCGHFILILILTMALTASKVSTGPAVTKGISTSRLHGIAYSLGKTTVHNKLHSTSKRIELRTVNDGHFSAGKLNFSNEGFSSIHGKPVSFIISRRSSILCFSTGTHNSEAKERVRPYGDCSDVSR